MIQDVNQPDKEILLELSEDEALTLRAVLFMRLGENRKLPGSVEELNNIYKKLSGHDREGLLERVRTEKES